MNARILLALAALAAPVLLSAAPREITLPPETMRLVESPLPGYQLAVAMCSTCHSAEYMAYQPPSARPYWQATVLKMQKVFGAPIPDSMVPPIVDYLVKTYGNDREGVSPPTPAAAKPASAPAESKGVPQKR